MRYLNIFFLSAQEALAERSRLFVWFLLGLISPLVLILFWRGSNNLGGWTIEQIISYYLLVIAMSAFVMSHHEDRIATIDIKEGGLTAYLLKPFSYFWIRFFNEIAYRVIQGAFGFIILFVFMQIFPKLFVFTDSVVIIFLSILAIVLALLLIFIVKTIVGITAFWITESRGVFEAFDVILTLFAGYLMPVVFLPQQLQYFIYLSPFPYMIYFPVIALEGKLQKLELIQIIGVQILWITFFYILYKKMWKEGIKKYTGVGQ